MANLVSLAKRRGFVFPASEIYGGLNGFWDFGPLGVALKNNIRDTWWRDMVECPPIGPDGNPLSIVGLDSAIIQNPKTWVASGHAEGFADLKTECTETKFRYRADHILCRAFAVIKSDTPPTEFVYVSGKVWLRPETAQGIFLNYKNVLDSSRVKVPFGIAQIGKAFRNEVTPRNFIFRTREFEQMEMEFFCPPEDSKMWYEFWVTTRLKWWEERIGLRNAKLQRREHDSDELAHYSTACADVEYQYPFSEPKFGELEGIAHRGNFDLTQHSSHSKTNLEYFDQENGNKRYLPHVIEPASGLTRGVLAVLCDAYEYDASRASPEWLRIKPSLAPIKAGVFPLVNKDGMPEMAEKIYLELRQNFTCQYDAKQSIGKRYARMDEAGTPFCLTVDGDSLKDQTVTVRNRDTATQERVAATQLKAYLAEKIA
ncbi:MAG: glycine--tRNA ligase [Alphaproteobacteria bacterium]|nr:glycine--tRNA ligase [Alphaproteobacteria bacterium]